MSSRQKYIFEISKHAFVYALFSKKFHLSIIFFAYFCFNYYEKTNNTHYFYHFNVPF